jgi:hypothetical protein
MAKDTIGTIELEIKKDNLVEFISKLENLSKIHDILRVKIDERELLMYTLSVPEKNNNTNSVLAMKYFVSETDEYFKNFDLKIQLDWILPNAKNFVKQAKIFAMYDRDLSIKIDYNTVTKFIYSARFSNKKLTITEIGGEPHQIKNLTREQIQSKLDPNFKEFNIDIPLEEFQQVKRLASLDSENDIIKVEVIDGILSFGEKWTLEIGDVSYKSGIWYFKKKYLGNIDETEFIKLNFYETFFVALGDKSNTMVTLELVDI